GTPMGALMPEYWIPALPSNEFPGPDSPPKRMKLLGENIIMYRDTKGRMGAIAEACPHRGASLYFARNGLRHPLRLSRLEIRPRRQLHLRAHRADGAPHALPAIDQGPRLPMPRRQQDGLDLYGPAQGTAAVPGLRDQHAALRSCRRAVDHDGRGELAAKHGGRSR